ncbi:MAG: AbrB/MazE/SpoVT family DNA-binding domain-containing protein [Armatimonadetes bacterium]|nr:AbrB/MazE/SpoVT family DNA-binding domain-containing protein [Armatimonadota bacterium]
MGIIRRNWREENDRQEEANVSEEKERKVFYGVGTVGERGQVVIPAEARRACHIEPGDKVMFLSHGAGQALLVARVADVLEAIGEMQELLQKAHEAQQEEETAEPEELHEQDTQEGDES